MTGGSSAPDRRLATTIRPSRFQAWPGVTGFSSTFYNTVCGIFSGSVLKCWGDNEFGKVGSGDPGGFGVYYSPVTVVGLGPVAGVVTGLYSTCAQEISGEVWCWGSYSGMGQGSPYPPGGTPTPERVTGF